MLQDIVKKYPISTSYCISPDKGSPELTSEQGNANGIGRDSLWKTRIIYQSALSSLSCGF